MIKFDTSANQNDHPRHLPRLPGIYGILNVVRRLIYVGSSHQARRRCVIHRSDLANGRHPNRYLQRDWLLDGSTAFKWVFLELVEGGPFCLREAESRYIATLRSGYGDRGYNLVLDPTISSLAADVRERMRLAHKGQRAWNKGIPCPAHVRLAISEFNTGRPKSAAARAKSRAAMLGPSHPFRGKKFPAEYRATLTKRVRSAGPLMGLYKGVHLDPRTKTFMARIYVEKKLRFLGRYQTEIEAAQAYNNAASLYYGDGCYLNPVPEGSPDRRTARGRPAREMPHVG